jgi:hypothetical protein
MMDGHVHDFEMDAIFSFSFCNYQTSTKSVSFFQSKSSRFQGDVSCTLYSLA